MGNESSTEVVQDEAKFLEGLQGMCVSYSYMSRIFPVRQPVALCGHLFFTGIYLTPKDGICAAVEMNGISSRPMEWN